MTETCWSCGVDQDPARPQRGDFASEPDYLIAALVYLDRAFPERIQQRERVAEWERLNREREVELIADRIRELLEFDEWDATQQIEADTLMASYLAHRRQVRDAANKTTNPRTTSKESNRS